MFPVLSVIVAILLGLYYREVIASPPAPDLRGTLLALAAVALFSRFLTALALRRPHPGTALFRATAITRLGAVAVYGLVVYACHWPAILGRGYLDIGDWLLVDELVLLLPYVVMLVLCYWAAWAAERSLDLHDFSLGGYLAFQLRQYLLPAVPVVLFFLLRDAVRLGAEAGWRWVAELRILYESFPFVQWLSLGVFLFLLYSLLPFLVRWIWRARPLPPGPLRDRLMAFSRRQGFRARDLLLWPTGGNVLNAAVIGPAGPFRYVMFTDGLLEQLKPDEVEAVFAHEVGHARHNHIILYFLFTIGYALLVYLLCSPFEQEIGAFFRDSPLRFVLAAITCILLWFGVLFGFISRRFEQQADVYGAISTGQDWVAGRDEPSSHPFVRALAGLSHQLGDIREAKGWRHFSLGTRIEFLERFLTDPKVRRRYRTNMGILLLTFFALLAGLGTAAATTVPAQVARGRVNASLLRASWLANRGEGLEARWELTEAQRLAGDSGRAISSITFPEDISDHELRLALWAAIVNARSPLPPYLVRIEAARILEQRGEASRAREVLFEALAGAGDDPVILNLLALSFSKEGRYRDAALAWRTALEITPPDLTDMRDRFEHCLARLPATD